MIQYKEKLFNSLETLYYIYEDYIWKNTGSNLEVLICDNTIGFYLYKDNELIDEIIFSFHNKEKKMYTYMSIKILLLLFGNVYMYIDHNVVYNKKHKDYLSLIINDDNILSIINDILLLQDDDVVSENMEIIRDISSKVPKRSCSLKFIEQLNNRIEASKKLLRRL